MEIIVPTNGFVGSSAWHTVNAQKVLGYPLWTGNGKMTETSMFTLFISVLKFFTSMCFFCILSPKVKPHTQFKKQSGCSIDRYFLPLPSPTSAPNSPSVKRGSGSFRKKDLSRLLITLRSCQRWGGGKDIRLQSGPALVPTPPCWSSPRAQASLVLAFSGIY